MTDKETSLAFVERMEKMHLSIPFSYDERQSLLRLAKTAALIEEHGLMVNPPDGMNPAWYASEKGTFGEERLTLHEAVLAVADKIKEQA